jgi:hypothetical protein
MAIEALKLKNINNNDMFNPTISISPNSISFEGAKGRNEPFFIDIDDGDVCTTYDCTLSDAIQIRDKLNELIDYYTPQFNIDDMVYVEDVVDSTNSGWFLVTSDSLFENGTGWFDYDKSKIPFIYNYDNKIVAKVTKIIRKDIFDNVCEIF